MSVVRLEYFPAAIRELQDAVEWYRERSPRAAEAFLREIDRALEIIVGAPTVWPRFENGTRRYVLRRFPYSVIYLDVETGVEIVAIAHHKRKPRYWIGRFDDHQG